MRFIRSIDIGKKILVLVTLCFMLTLVQAGSASTVTVQDAGVTSIGGTANVEIRLDSAPAGLSGYNITFSLSNPGIAEITQVTFPSWAGVTQTSTFPSDQVWLKALDLMNTAGSSNILLATLTIRGDAAGTTNVVPTVNQLDDDSGGIILSATDPGVFTVTVPQQNRAPELTAIGNKNVNEGQLLQFTVTATDPDGDSLSYSTSALPSGAQFNPTTRVFTWTPGVTQSGSYPVTFTVSDGLLTDSEQITISVGNVNRAPELTAIGNKNVNEGQLLQFTVTATDPDGDSLSYSTSALPSGAQFNPTTRVFTWTPGVTQSGSYPVTFTVSDGLLTDSEQITISVGNVNRAPELTAIGNKNVNEGQLLQFTVTATDPDGDSLSYSTSALPSGAQFNPTTRVFTWTPGVTQSGSYPVTFTVSDGLLTDSEQITISVGNVNRAPELTAIGNKNVNEGQLLQFTVTATDPDGDSLSYSTSALPSGAQFNPTTRVFTWTPTNAQSGSYPVTFTVSDGLLTDSEQITISVGNVNRAPELTAIGNKNVNEGQLLQFTVTATDPDGDSLSYSTSALPSGAQFNPTTRVFTWTPTNAQSGSYPVTFTVSDGLLTDSEQITISVGNVNRAPELTAIGNKNVNEGQLLQFTVTATDPDGDSLSYSTSALPSGAQFNPTTRVFTWTPGVTQSGSYPVTFTVSDGLLTDSEQITMTVTDVQENLAPELSPIGNKNVNEGQLLQFTVTATDPDGDSLSYSTSALPSGAQFNPTTRVFTWTPTNAQSGSYPVTFTVSDGLLTDSEQITMTVTDVQENLAPELSPIGNKNVNEGQLLQFTVTATDPDGDSLSYSTSALPSGAQFNPTTRVFTWTPTNAQSGSYPVTFTVSDGLLTDSEQITMTVTDVQENLAPELSPIGNKNVNEGQLLQFTVTATDPDGDSLTYSTSALPTGAQFDPATGIFIWTPGDTQSGPYIVTFTVSDGSIEDSEIVTITVLDKGVLDAAFLMDITSGTAPLVVHFSDQSSGNVRFRVWSFGDGSFSFEKNPVHTYRETGTYTVRLRVWDGKIVDTEVKTDCITVTQPELQADFTADTTSGTAPLKVRFMDASTGNVRYRTWYFGDGDTSHAQNAVHTYREAGTYTVRLVVSDGRGTDTEVKTDYITVTQPELQADFTADTTSGTAPLKVRFSDMSSGKVQFRVWSFGDGSSSFEKDPVHTYREAGTYTVRLTVYGKGDLDMETKTSYIRVSRPNSRNR